jgi:hypothetical protein
MCYCVIHAVVEVTSAMIEQVLGGEVMDVPEVDTQCNPGTGTSPGV